MGSEVFHSWARRQQQKKEQEYDPQPGVNRKEKKALLVHPAGDNRNRRADLHPRVGGGGRFDPFANRRKWSAVGIPEPCSEA
jgi:hypothetical protein